MIHELVVPPEAEGLRTDVFLSEVAGVCARSRIRHRLRRLTCGDRAIKPAHRVSHGERIVVELADEEPLDLTPERADVPIPILYEDERVIVVDKPQGIVVHPARGNGHGTLVQHLLADLPDDTDGTLRPGIVHRLDKDTSGVMIVAKTVDAHSDLAAKFAERRVQKTYLALVKGSPAKRGATIRTRLGRDPHQRKRFAVVSSGGKDAVTSYRVLHRYPGYTVVALSPRTGRTHQLRVHMAHIGHPVLGDPIYSRHDGNYPQATLMLHAHRLLIALPGEDRPILFRAPLPERFRALIRSLAGG